MQFLPHRREFRPADGSVFTGPKRLDDQFMSMPSAVRFVDPAVDTVGTMLSPMVLNNSDGWFINGHGCLMG